MSLLNNALFVEQWERMEVALGIQGAGGSVIEVVDEALRRIKALEEVHDEHKRLVRELDVLINGEAGAAKQASLIDLFPQVRELVKNDARVALKRENYHMLSTMVRIYHGFKTDNAMSDAFGYSAELNVEMMRKAVESLSAQ